MSRRDSCHDGAELGPKGDQIGPRGQRAVARHDGVEIKQQNLIQHPAPAVQAAGTGNRGLAFCCTISATPAVVNCAGLPVCWSWWLLTTSTRTGRSDSFDIFLTCDINGR